MINLKEFLKKQQNEDSQKSDEVVLPEELEVTEIPMMEGFVGKERDRDPPAILVMRRKSIRQFPNGQRVALYYVDKINKYVTIPYSDMEWSVKEETIFDKIKEARVSNKNVVVEHFDGTTTEVTPLDAKNIIDFYRKVNESNKKKMLDMLEASAEHFRNIAKFSKG